jgi:1-deoxy-D-xylulose-5-phosphate reductoisomerase
MLPSYARVLFVGKRTVGEFRTDLTRSIGATSRGWQYGEVRRVIILGSTGSIGTQAIEVIQANPDLFKVVGLSAGSNAELLNSQASLLGVEASKAVLGAQAATELVENTDADVVVNGITGSIGLAPTLATLATGKTLALANKESLIVGGRLVTDAARPGQIVPVDSEHSALAQCLLGGTAAGAEVSTAMSGAAKSAKSSSVPVAR